MQPQANSNGLSSKPYRCTRRRLLFLLPFAPRLDSTDGGGRSIAQLLTKLADRHDIALLYLRAVGDPALGDNLQKKCELVEEVMRPEVSFGLAQRWSRLTSVLQGTPLWATGLAVKAYGERLRTLSQAWKPDIVQIEYHVMGQYLSALDGCPAPRVLTEHEPGVRSTLHVKQLHPILGFPIDALDKLAWGRFEPAIIRRVQAVVTFTEEDKKTLERFAGRTPILRIPHGIVIPEHPSNPPRGLPLSLVFIGNFMHPPNVDAALRLVQVIFRMVQKYDPELELYIVGDQAPPQLKKMASSRVVVTGRVPDVAPYLDRAAIFVAPLRSGGGIRVKVLEALAAGKAVVASPLAIEGLDLVDGEQVVLAESDQQFSDAIVQLLANPAKRVSLAARARTWACANLDWGKSIATYEALYESLILRSAIPPQTR